MKTIIRQKDKTKSIIPHTPKWASRKALSNTYIASAVQHFRTTENIDNRCYLITAHKETSAGKNKLLPSHRAICTSIYKEIVKLFSTTYTGNSVDISPQDKPGVIFCGDAAGTRSDANQINFKPRDKHHIHALLFLPFEMSDERTDVAFMHKLVEVIRDVDGIRKFNIGTTNGSVLVEKFTPNTPLWWTLDYSDKAERFTYAHQDFQPLVFPYQQILEKYEPSTAKTNIERERCVRKRNAVLAGQTRTLRNLTYSPNLFYASEMCRDFSVSHKALLACSKLTKPENYTPSERELKQIISWRGSFDGSQRGNLTPISSGNTSKPSMLFDAVQPAEWGISLGGYIDESACRVALGKAVNPPSLSQQGLMPTGFWQSPSQHAWLKTQNLFHQRLAFWRMHFRLFPVQKASKVYR